MLGVLRPGFGKPLLEGGGNVFQFSSGEGLFHPLQKRVGGNRIRGQFQKLCTCAGAGLPSLIGVAPGQSIENEIACGRMTPELRRGEHLNYLSTISNRLVFERPPKKQWNVLILAVGVVAKQCCNDG